MEAESLIHDTGVLVSVINKFYYYVQSRDGDHWDGCLHFGDPESVLGFEEGYKSLIAQEALIMLFSVRHGRNLTLAVERY